MPSRTSEQPLDDMESVFVPVEKETLDGFRDIGRQEGFETDGDIFRYLVTL